MRKEKIVDPENIIDSNIRCIRIEKVIGQIDLVKQLQLNDVEITRETLVKIESGRQHIKLKQLKSIKKILIVDYDEILIK